MFKCDVCQKEFLTKKSLSGHKTSHSTKPRLKKGEGWRSKTKEMNSRVCQYCSKEFFKENGNFRAVSGHVTTCHLNPNRQSTIDKITKAKIGTTLSDEHRNNISSSMKLAHEEGRAWNIGKSRWNNPKN